MFRRLAPLFNWAILLAAIAGVIYPAFIDGPHGASPPGVSQLLIKLFIEPHLDLGYLMRLLCLFVVIASIYLVIVTRLYSRVPLTVVSTSISIRLNEDLSRAIITRRQVLRANQPGVTAYFCTLAPSSPTGIIPQSELDFQVHCPGCTLNSRIEWSGTENAGYEIIHHFGGEMPYRWYMPLLPGWELRKPIEQMHAFIRRCLVVRSQRYIILNEFNVAKPLIEYQATVYPQLNLDVRIEYPGPVPKTLSVGRVKSAGVVSIQPELDAHCAHIFVDRLQGETLRIGW